MKWNATASITCRAYTSITCRAVTVCSVWSWSNGMPCLAFFSRERKCYSIHHMSCLSIHHTSCSNHVQCLAMTKWSCSPFQRQKCYSIHHMSCLCIHHMSCSNNNLESWGKINIDPANLSFISLFSTSLEGWDLACARSATPSKFFPFLRILTK